MLEILNNYPWTRLSVRIIGLIKRQFFHMVTHVFDDSNLSLESFAINTLRPVICSLGHGRKHMLTILPTKWRPGLMLLHSKFEFLFDSDIPYSKVKTTDKNTDSQITDSELFIQ